MNPERGGPFGPWRASIRSPLSADDLLQRFGQRLPTRFEFLSGGPASGRIVGQTFRIIRSGVMPAKLFKVRLKAIVEKGASGSIIACVSEADRLTLGMTLLAMAVGLAGLLYALIRLIAGGFDAGDMVVGLVVLVMNSVCLWIPFGLELKRAQRDWAYLTGLVSDWANE